MAGRKACASAALHYMGLLSVNPPSLLFCTSRVRVPVGWRTGAPRNRSSQPTCRQMEGRHWCCSSSGSLPALNLENQFFSFFFFLFFFPSFPFFSPVPLPSKGPNANLLLPRCDSSFAGCGAQPSEVAALFCVRFPSLLFASCTSRVPTNSHDLVHHVLLLQQK